MKCWLEHYKFILFGDKPFDRNRTVIDFQGNVYIFNVVTRQPKITYVAHVIFLLASKECHRGNGSDSQSPLPTSCLLCIPTGCNSWDWAYHTQKLEKDQL